MICLLELPRRLLGWYWQLNCRGCGQASFYTSDWQSSSNYASWVYLFQGGRYDSFTNLYNFRNRDLSPTLGVGLGLGRWLEQDPAGYAGGDSNLYGEEASNPVNGADPYVMADDPTQPYRANPVLISTPSCMICHGRIDSYGNVDFSGMSASKRVWAGRWLNAQSIDLDELERKSARITAFGPTQFSIGFGEGAYHLATHPWEIVTVPLMMIYTAVVDPEQSKADVADAGKALFWQPARTGGNMAGNAVVAAPFAWAGVKALGIAVDYTGLRIPASAGIAAARSPVWSSATGDVVVNGANLPGSAGIQIGRRLTTTEMEALTQSHGVEFSLVYRTGPGPNGAGGTYWLHSGTINTVDVPIGSNIRWISHTHPGGTPYASGMMGDQGVLQALQAAGSPQQSSVIVPVGGQPFRFNLQNTRVP